MPPPILYMINISPPVRGVLMTAMHLKLDLQQKVVNTLKGEQKKPEYSRINPQHTVPTLDDNGFILWDSHAIVIYLVERYAEDDSLYPKDLQKRAVINQRLHFDNGVLFTRFIKLAAEALRDKKPVTEHDLEPFIEAYDFLEAFLGEKGPYIAGETLSVADFSIISTLSSCETFLLVDEKKWPKLALWYKKIQALPAYQANIEGLKVLKSFAKK